MIFRFIAIIIIYGLVGQILIWLDDKYLGSFFNCVRADDEEYLQLEETAFTIRYFWPAKIIEYLIKLPGAILTFWRERV